MANPILDLIIARDGGCVASGQLPGECFGPLAPHHMVNRGMGGSRLYGAVAWRLTVCEGHNGAMESDPATAELARALGFKYSRNGLKPSMPRVHYRDGWHYLIGVDRIPEASL